jgi:hypothetical protein
MKTDDYFVTRGNHTDGADLERKFFTRFADAQYWARRCRFWRIRKGRDIIESNF